MIKIYAPASIGNINVGFDTLGVAISPINNKLLGDCVTIKSNHTFNLINTGRFCFQLPKKIEENIVWKCWHHFCKILKKKNTRFYYIRKKYANRFWVRIKRMFNFGDASSNK